MRFLFSWPWHKSVTFTERPDGGADVMLTELLLTPEGKIKGSEAVREFTLGASEYRDFLAAFDQATAGYRFGFDLLTYDGLEIGYERWNDGQASHYKGNASDYRQDFTAMSLVLQLIRRHGGFAQDRYPDRFGD